MPSPMAARLANIHERLAAGSRTASRDLFVEALHPLMRFVRRRAPALSDDDRHDIATDVLLNYVSAQDAFDPSLRSLWGYLCMIASADAVDLTRKRGRRQALLDEASVDVEDWWCHANCDSSEGANLDARRLLERFGDRIATNEVERLVLALILREERSVKAYAEALALDPQQPETTVLVKQAKDRLLTRLRRLGREL